MSTAREKQSAERRRAANREDAAAYKARQKKKLVIVKVLLDRDSLAELADLGVISRDGLKDPKAQEMLGNLLYSAVIFRQDLTAAVLSRIGDLAEV